MNSDRISVSPSAGTRTRGGAVGRVRRRRPRVTAHADVHGDDRTLITLRQHVDGKVVEHAAVDEQARPSRRGGNSPGMLIDAITADVRSPVRCTYGRARLEVRADAPEHAGQLLDVDPRSRRRRRCSVLRPLTSDTVGTV